MGVRLDRMRALEVFVMSVSAGGISAGARRLGLPPSSVSRTIRGLEERIGVTLLARGPRLFRLTAEGEALYERGRRLLSDMDTLEQDVGSRGRPVGTLRISTSVAFGRVVILPLLTKFRELYPYVDLQLSLTDRYADIESGDADVALRVGPLADSALTARKLAESQRVVVASPAYLASRGLPLNLADLAAHQCLRLARERIEPWPFLVDGIVERIDPVGDIEVDEGESLAQLALAGHGIARVGAFHVKDAITAGHLVELFADKRSEDTEIFYAVFLGGGMAPARVRVFVDYLVRSLSDRRL